MSSIGKKILAAFVEIQDEAETVSAKSAGTYSNTIAVETGMNNTTGYGTVPANDKFRQHFDQLFKEANMPGPDYYEFAAMVEAMQSIPDEKTRFLSAFAGLSVQGLNKTMLVKSAGQYIAILETDATNFNATINTALNEKVALKKQALEEKVNRIKALTNEIAELNTAIVQLGAEVKENEEKINKNLDGYAAESEKYKTKIWQDIEKINSLL